MSGGPLRVAIVGYGKIAQDQHVPAIRANPDLELVACVSRRDIAPEGMPSFGSIGELRAAGLAVDAAALCNTPGERLETALETIAAGWHTLLEKPAASTLGAAETITRVAAGRGISLFATWHSRFAPAVETARRILAGRRIDRIDIRWRENVRKWHPNQAWIWQAGGFGVFDPGINALSIATRILELDLDIATAQLEIPANRQMPIAAALQFTGPCVPAAASAAFDWRAEVGEEWTIAIDHDAGTLTLLDGGDRLLVDGQPALLEPEAEYPALYRRFVDLVRAKASDVDLSPLRLVADAFLVGTRRTTDAFED